MPNELGSCRAGRKNICAMDSSLTPSTSAYGEKVSCLEPGHKRTLEPTKPHHLLKRLKPGGVPGLRVWSVSVGQRVEGLHVRGEGRPTCVKTPKSR